MNTRKSALTADKIGNEYYILAKQPEEEETDSWRVYVKNATGGTVVHLTEPKPPWGERPRVYFGEEGYQQGKALLTEALNSGWIPDPHDPYPHDPSESDGLQFNWY